MKYQRRGRVKGWRVKGRRETIHYYVHCCTAIRGGDHCTGVVGGRVQKY